MIQLISNATGLKSAFVNVDDLADYMEDYRVTGRQESADAVAYEIEWTGSGRRTRNIIVVDRDELDALPLMEERNRVRLPL